MESRRQSSWTGLLSRPRVAFRSAKVALALSASRLGPADSRGGQWSLSQWRPGRVPLLLVLLLAGCRPSAGPKVPSAGPEVPSARPEVVVYAALDAEFSEPILEDFGNQTGVHVRSKFDVESTKTVGLVNAIIQERQRPRCDVFWNNEILHTLRLRKLGLLEAYPAEAARGFPAAYRADDGTWHGLAARARVLLVNTELVAEDNRPDSIEDLVDPRWKGQAGIARPLFGTTATHAAVLMATWGPERAEHFFRQVRENAQVLSGNKQVALAVGRGQLAFGLTDTDDAIIELDQGRPVAIVFPDQGPEQLGTLFIPNTLCIMRDCPHPETARRLVEFLLAADVERRLAKGASAQFPVNPAVEDVSRAAPDQPVRWMEVDFAAAAEAWDTAAELLREIFE